MPPSEGTLHVLSAGAGIGGPTAALALRRAGFDVHMYERRNLARDPGSATTYRRMCDLLWEWMARVGDPYGNPRFGASVVLPRSSATS